MSKEQNTPVNSEENESIDLGAESTSKLPPGKWVSADQLGESIGTAIANSLGGLIPAKKETYGQYVRRMAQKNPKPKLDRPCYDNGALCQEWTLSAKDIELFNRIERPGFYIQRKVQVIIRNFDMPKSDQVVEIRYSDKTIDQRFENKGLFRNFTDLLRQVVDEQDVALENERELKELRAEQLARKRTKAVSASA